MKYIGFKPFISVFVTNVWDNKKEPPGITRNGSKKGSKNNKGRPIYKT
jgi:hypothetical protein